MPYLTIAKYVGGLILGLILAWILYAGLIRPTTKPNPTSKQEAQYITNYNITSRQSFGCSRFEVIKPEKRKEPNGNPNSVVSGGSSDLPQD